MTLHDILEPFGGELYSESFKAVRKKLGMTQEELADKLYVSIKTVSRYENDHCEVPQAVFTMLWALVQGDDFSCDRSDNYMRFHNAESLVNTYDKVLFVEVEVDVPYSSIQVMALGVDKVGSDEIKISVHQAGDSLEIRGQYSWPDMSVRLPLCDFDDDEKISVSALEYFCKGFDKHCNIRGIDHTLEFNVPKVEDK